jgi:hypothetical protein
VHEQARNQLAIGAHHRQAAGAHVGRGVLELADQPPARGVQSLAERDARDGRLGAPCRGKVEEVIDEALGA